ncbi:hypothetical protein BTO28_08610 [Domibacillus epiphyticus]|uniref:Zinc ribbon domain-containing protein n=2 Tax=Domibacillus epiphyticus TaxID=1714355 RepID=A0A1V2A8C5_9BACI|nr:hypothetical protein BTO28_08610 [Domibacillus epiphyticus]
MLMKTAEISAADDFGRDSILAVWVSFEESIRIERIKVIDSEADPFLQWTMGKILIEVLNKIIELKPSCIDTLSNRLANFFSYSGNSKMHEYEQYAKILNDYIDVLEVADIEDNKALSKKAPSAELVKILDNPASFKRFMLQLIEDFELERIVLLFDEAAHVFSSSQQEKFFTFFKSLIHPKIACKASVYPGITNYGKYFERNHDAKELRISWSPHESEDVTYVKKILKKRIQDFNIEYWNKLTVNNEIINTVCTCSNGNPRFVFHIIDELQNTNAFKQKSITTTMLINCLRTVNEAKWSEFITLKNRLVKYKQHIIEAETFIKNLVIPNLREWNNKRRSAGKKLSVGFYIETSAFEKISKLFDILAYSNFITVNDSKKSMGKGKYGYYITINPSLLFSDLVIRDFSEMNNISINIDNNQAYFESTSEINKLIQKLSKTEEEYHCSNSKCEFITSDISFTFCKKCGSKMEISEQEPLYKILRGHSIENLNLSHKIVSRLKTKFNTIGEIYDAKIDDIRMSYIQDVRIEKIKNAAVEYMAG